MLSPAMPGPPRLSPTILPRTKADHRNSAAAIAKTAPTLVTARRRPPSAGPTKKPTLSSVVEVAFAAVSSSADRASEGSSADWAGPKAVPVTAAMAASA